MIWHKSDIVKYIAKDTNLEVWQVERIYSAILRLFLTRLGLGHEIVLQGFGRFEITKQGKTKSNLPMWKNRVFPPKFKVKFSPGETLIEYVMKFQADCIQEALRKRQSTESPKKPATS